MVPQSWAGPVDPQCWLRAADSQPVSLPTTFSGRTLERCGQAVEALLTRFVGGRDCDLHRTLQ
jgi:hypothetical protein